MRGGRGWLVVALLLGVAGSALAAGPRWVTGPPYFTTSGQAVIWYTDTPLYFTDPGDLSSTVNHAAADALVAAAAAVWNMPTSRLVLARGGALDEHVSGANTYVGSSGALFPADVQAANSAVKQIAVIYDRDGSVTDLLLGTGASDPSGCRQSAVTESVDSITPDGFIRHAVLVLNGRCTGSDPAMQLQMQYQVMRAFGRIIGLGWSQTNDNVFTGSPAPTPQQAMHWPLMHPIDIICGPYTYQCLPQPFTPRMDDVSGMSLLYFIDQGQAGPGKTDSLLNANRIAGHINFPNGQGMQGVNVVGRRLDQYMPLSQTEQWESVSSVSGYPFRQNNGNPVTGTDSSMAGSMGVWAYFYEGWYQFSRVDMLPGNWQYIFVETQPVNPLYVGEYSVGPYTENTVVPSGTPLNFQAGIFPSYANYSWYDLTVDGAASNCTGGGGGPESSPQGVAAGGWWQGQLCGYGQTEWSGLTVRANRSLTVEVTAEDEDGFASTAKAMPVIGVWRATDALGMAPGVAVSQGALNVASAGMTSLEVDGPPAGGLRIAIADERGDGRPDFNFGARVLYADQVTPANVPAGGGVVTITGMGFRAGNAVTVNGVVATVQSWSPTAIVAMVPGSRRLVSGLPGAMVTDVAVSDVSTGGRTVMTGALAYSAALPEVMQVVSAPTGTVGVGVAAGTAFAVKVLASDGVTPVAGAAVAFSASGGTVSFGVCDGASCTVVTDSTMVTPLAAGVIVLGASGDGGSVSASFTAVAAVRSMTVTRAVEYVAAGVGGVAWSPQVALADNSASVAGVVVSWTGSAGMNVGSGSSVADGPGVASVGMTVGPVAAGAQAVGQACAWGGTVCAGFAAQGVDSTLLQVGVVSGAGQSVAASGTLGAVVVQVTDGMGHPVAGAAVEVYQTVEPGVACPTQGRCPAQPVGQKGQTAVVSDADGLMTVTPMQLTGVPEVTNLVVTAGTQGFVSLALSKGW